MLQLTNICKYQDHGIFKYFYVSSSYLITLNLKYSMPKSNITLRSRLAIKQSMRKIQFENESFSYFPAQPHTKYSSQDQMTGF